MSGPLTYRPELDGLRCLAVLLVLVAHAPMLSDFVAWNGVKFVGEAVHAGYLGVDIFFVLSGFLITRVLLKDREKEFGQTIKIFFLKRVLRIFPIFYLTVLYCWFVLDIPDPEAWANLFYVSNYYYSVVPGMSPLRHTWSLSVEEQFYLIMPFVVLLTPLSRLTSVMFWGTLFIVALSMLLSHLLLDPQTSQLLTIRGVTFRMLSLCAGALMAIHLDRVLKIPLWPVLVMAFLVLPLAQLGVRLWNGPGSHFIILPIFTAWSVSIFLTVLLSAERHLWLARPFQAKVPIYLGRISYGIYVYHLVIFHQMNLREGYREGGVPAWELLAAIALVLLVAAASFRFIESPLLKLKDRIGKREAKIQDV